MAKTGSGNSKAAEPPKKREKAAEGGFEKTDDDCSHAKASSSMVHGQVKSVSERLQDTMGVSNRLKHPGIIVGNMTSTWILLES